MAGEALVAIVSDRVLATQMIKVSRLRRHGELQGRSGLGAGRLRDRNCLPADG